MAKKVRKRRIKKEKVSRKKKIKEISKEKLKKFEEELKEKKSKLIKKPKGKSQRIQEESMVSLEEFLRSSRAPVLERVAIAEEIPIPTRIQQARDRETGTQTVTNYASISSDYADITSSNQGTTENNLQFTEATNYNTMFEETKEAEESRRLLTKGDDSRYQPRGGENDSRVERQTFIQGDKEFRKYISKGDVK